MAKKYQGFKFTYNSTTTTFSTMIKNVTRTSEESTSIVTTPTGAKYKQVFGSGKYKWVFNFDYSEREAFSFFNNAYEAAIDGYALTFSEEQDSGAYTDYTVIINRPQATPNTLGTTNLDRGLSVEIYQV